MSEQVNNSAPGYIVIEGPIGVGKTTLAKRIAHSFSYQALLEQAERNPFLGKFYRDRRQNALATQLSFLFQRHQQLQDVHQDELFSPAIVADYLIDKDDLFAQANLDDEEYKLYKAVSDKLESHYPTPDLVIYLQAPVDILLERIHERGIPEEQSIDRRYLETLNELYSQLFLYYDRAPLLIVNASQIDLVNDQQDYDNFIEYMLKIKSGRHFYNPSIF